MHNDQAGASCVAGHGLTLDQFQIVAEPLPNPEERVFRCSTIEADVTYGAYSIKLVREAKSRFAKYEIVVDHGAGRERLTLTELCDPETTIAAILGLDERAQYSILFALWKSAKAAAGVSAQETGRKWAQAFVDNRIRKGRADRSGRRAITITPPVAPETLFPNMDLPFATR